MKSAETDQITKHDNADQLISPKPSSKPYSDAPTGEARTNAVAKRSAIRFKETVQGHLILGLDRYTDDELKACWYTEEENKQIEQDMMKELHMMVHGKILQDKKYCSQGLEQYLPENAIPKSENRRTAADVVLKEQSRHYETQEHYEEAIATVYKNISSSCQLWAAVVGFRDQREAEIYLDDDGDGDDWEDLVTTPFQQPSRSISTPAKTYANNSIRSMAQPRQVAISARSA